MQILIKQIREHLNISQTELAEQLNVTFATVNRWENGRAVPNKLAQTKLYEICKENDAPVYDITQQDCKCRREHFSIERSQVALPRLQIWNRRQNRTEKPSAMRFWQGILHGH